ncbi:hypothetical protein NEF87_001241 [Candidatus Lokiarchaeum ossiferum]|uniref:MarR family transcriptional regulator n=1 Tax=Candidatus Lokiarchaeum ossiferum TaxID=2951803 RepID=A0ABY6HQW6_9ARCH|nr:hypothetical protein NEF87_001241 [Candidatus Lokiarchaeum sp. B-35]
MNNGITTRNNFNQNYNNQMTRMIDPILDGPLKEYEQRLLSFFVNIARISSLDHTTTEIFGYMQIYDALTQESLRDLTQTTFVENTKNQKKNQKAFSTSTISTTLRSLIQGNILTRGHIPSTHKFCYKLKSDVINFVYQDFSLIVRDLEVLDEFLINLQNQISEFSLQYPQKSQFLSQRINGVRNYIEVQRRTISEEKKYDFFSENIRSLKKEKEIIEFPPELVALEKIFISYNVENNIFFSNDTVLNHTFNYLQTRHTVTQNLIEQQCSLSLSTISRKLSQLLEQNIIQSYPKVYQKSRIYFLESISVAMLEAVIASDNYIYSWVDKFQESLTELIKNKVKLQKLTGYKHLVQKYSQILKTIDGFRSETAKLKKNLADLTKFLKQESTE